MSANINGIIQSEDRIKILKEFADNPVGFLLIAGGNGTGKSYAAEAIYNKNSRFKLPYYDHDESYFLNFSELYQLYLNKIFHTESLREELKKTKLLVIDDLCANKNSVSDSFSGFLYSVIDFRSINKISHNLGTVVTTNLNSDEMGKFMGPAFRSRIASGFILRLDGIDRRLSPENEWNLKN